MKYRTMILVLAVLLAGVELRADPPDLLSSIPSFDGASWSSFDANQGQPAKLGLVLAYPFDPLSTIVSANVHLTPNPGHSEITCTATGAPPIPGPSNLDQCFYQVSPNQIIIYYMGSFTPGQAVNYRVDSIVTTGAVYDNFNTSSVSAGNPVPVAGRDPARFVLVLDKSGSMDWSSHPIDPGCEVHSKPPPASPCLPTRWDVLNNAVTAMLSVAEPYAMAAHDEFGAVLFDTGVTASQNIASLDSANVASLQGLLTSNSPGGWTSMGSGAQHFETELASGAASHNEFMLIFSDGEQNRPPYLLTNNAIQQVVLDPDDPIDTAHPEFLPGGTIDNPAVDLCPFSMRGDDPADPDSTDRLQKIADWRCKGISYADVKIAGAPDLVQFFLQVLDGVLIGDKLELAAVSSGRLTQGPTTVTDTATFRIAPRDRVFTVLVTWTETGNGLSSLILRKDGVEFQPVGGPTSNQPLGRISRGRNHVTVTLANPFCVGTDCVDPEGQWELELTPFFEVSRVFNYNVFVTTDHPSIATEFQALQPTPGVGEPFALSTRMTDGGVPVAGLASGSVTAEVCRPDSSLGNTLSDSDAQPGGGPDIDTISAAGLKFAAMLADPAQRVAALAAVQATNCDTVTLNETDPGLYEAGYTNTVAEGVYSIRFAVDADTASTGRFTRVWTQTRYVSVVAEEEATGATAVVQLLPCAAPSGCIRIELRPVDGSGNRLGPGKGSLFQIAAADGTLMTEPQDLLDGRYIIDIERASGATGDVSFEIGDATIDVPGSSPGGLFGGIPWWLWLLLLIILILIIIWILLRRSSP